MKSHSSSLFSLLFLLLLPCPSLFYSLKNCTADFYDPNTIFCDNNQLITIPNDIPKSTTVLTLSHNHIERIRHTDLTGLGRLKTLDFMSNAVSLIEDGAFQDLSNLTQLNLEKNKLTNLTDNMFKGLSNLVMLNLKSNYIVYISVQAFKPLEKLQELDLIENELVQVSDLGNIDIYCPLLRDLYLGNNYFTFIDSDTFQIPLCNIVKLHLGYGSLKKFRIHSNIFPHLESLVLATSESEFIWDVSDKSFLKSLKMLDISMPKLPTETYRIIFQSLDSVRSLNLEIYFSSIDKDMLDLICAIPSLEKLQIYHYKNYILDNTLLQSCSNLTELGLHGNRMTELSESSLRMLTRLTLLDLDVNHLTHVPLAIRNMTTLKTLSFRLNHITELHCSDFLNLPSLTELNLRSNKISKISPCVFEDLQSLRVLDLKDNLLSRFDDGFGASLSRLVVLNANENNLGWLQKNVFKNMSSLTDLNLNSKAVTDVEDGAFEGLLNLKQLTFSLNYESSTVFAGLEELKNLTMFIYMPQMGSTFMDHEPMTFKGLHSLQVLTIEVDKDICSNDVLLILQGLNNLQVFSLDTNCFDSFYTGDLFVYTPNLLNLQIINCVVFKIDSDLFEPIPDLKVLDLSHNKIKSLDFLLKANLTKLEKLILVNNELMVINETVFDALPSLKHLNLSGNPFICDCSNAGFIKWAVRNKQVQVVNAFQYRCSYPLSQDGHFLFDFNVQFCLESTYFLCFISSSALVLVTLLSSFIYHFLRWQLVYGYYLFQAFLYDSKKKRQGCPDLYDAFVSYNVHNEEWVYRELLPELEGQQGWRLCLHHRDFQPGRAIIENITDAIYSSRKTLCVISHRYLQSEWCSQEIQLASFRLFDEQQDVLILLFLEEISSNQLNPFYRMRKLVKSHTYLSWTQAWSHKGVFWEKVRRALETGNDAAEVNLLNANI